MSTDCAPPAEFTKNIVNGIEITDMHVENACTNSESIINHNVSESSVQQGKSTLPENMDISSDSSQQGKAAKCYFDKGAHSYELIERHNDPKTGSSILDFILLIDAAMLELRKFNHNFNLLHLIIGKYCF